MYTYLYYSRITITGAGDNAAARQADERNKGLIFKDCVLFINCKSGINYTEIDNAKDIDIVVPMYTLVKYIDNLEKNIQRHSETCGSLWWYYKNEPNDNLTDSGSFKSKVKITGNTPAGGNTKNAKIIVPLEYLIIFWRTFEMLLINCEINLILTCLSICVMNNSTGAVRFARTDTKPFVSVVTLSTKDNAKLYQQLKSGFKRTINWNKFQSDTKTYAQNEI